MLDLDELTNRAVDSPIAAPPAIDDVRRRARQRRRRRSAFSVVVVSGIVVLAAAVGYEALRSGPTPAPLHPAVLTTPSTPDAQSIVRPVLTSCTATSAQEGTTTGSGLTDPERAGEVFARPDNSVAGPLAVLLRPPADSGSSRLSLMPNATVAGQPANYGAGEQGQSGVTWLLPGGGPAYIYARDLSESEVFALAEAVTNSGPLPSGLVSLGMTSQASWARSICADATTVHSVIEVIHGSPASRYAHLVSEPPGLRWDEGDTTFLLVTVPMDPNTTPPVVNQASVEQWNTLVAARRALAPAPSTEVPQP